MFNYVPRIGLVKVFEALRERARGVAKSDTSCSDPGSEKGFSKGQQVWYWTRGKSRVLARVLLRNSKMTYTITLGGVTKLAHQNQLSPYYPPLFNTKIEEKLEPDDTGGEILQTTSFRVQ